MQNATVASGCPRMPGHIVIKWKYVVGASLLVFHLIHVVHKLPQFLETNLTTTDEWTFPPTIFGTNAGL